MRASMLFVALFGVLLGLASVQATAPVRKDWLYVPNVCQETRSALMNAFDVRFAFEGAVVLQAPAGLTEAIARRYKGALPLGPVLEGEEEEQLYVYIRQTLKSDTPASIAKWGAQVLSALRNQVGARVAFTAPRQVYVFGPRDASFPVEGEATQFLAVSPVPMRPARHERASRLAAMRAARVHNVAIEDLIDQVSESRLEELTTYLTGEADDSPFVTRHASGSQIDLAATWIKDHYETNGFNATLHHFSGNYGPNVIAIYPGTEEPDTHVIIGAHYDSRQANINNPEARAPGANDDGSGTAALLHVAELIAQNNLSFRYTVILGSWCAEEQGLIGSRAYASMAASEGHDILAMIQADMLAYQAEGEAVQIAFPSMYATESLTDYAIDVVEEYVPELEVCYTNACCSDHMSFWERGFESTQIFERCGGIADDEYHSSNDVVNRPGYSIPKLALNTQAFFAILLSLAL